MSEETNNKPTSGDVNAGGNDNTTGLIERADAIAKRLEEAEKRIDEKTARYEQLVARNMLSGKSMASDTAPQVETPKQYAERIMRGGKK